MPRPLRQSRLPPPLAVLAALLLGAAAHAQEARSLHVGTSGDYAPFSLAVTVDEDSEETAFEGFDVAVARAYADDRGLALVWVPFRWPRLLGALEEGRFEVAMGGVTVRPERSAAGRFTVPVLETGAVALVREPDRWRSLEALDSRPARIGVNGGGHLEQVSRKHFTRATLIVVPDNSAVLAALLDESVDAVVTDTVEAMGWMLAREGMAVYGPFSRDRKAYLVRADRPALAADLDAWLLAREADGALAELRAEHLGEAAGGPVATPLGSLLAAIDERLGLMPLVGVAKREQGLPLEVPEREQLVLDAAAAGVARAAEAAGRPGPAPEAVRALFRAQMEAAKQVQWETVQDEASWPAPPYPDVETVLRPALLRIGERIARLLLELPADLDEGSVRAAARAAIRTARVPPASVRAIAEAVAAVSRTPPGKPAEGGSPAQPGRVKARAASPASTGTATQTP